MHSHGKQDRVDKFTCGPQNNRPAAEMRNLELELVMNINCSLQEREANCGYSAKVDIQLKLENILQLTQ